MENQKEQILVNAVFNRAVKTYIFLSVAAGMFITIIGIPFAIIWLCGVGQWYSKHYFAKLECVLTPTYLRFKKGIIVQFEKTIPLDTIQDLSFIEGPFLRALNLCILRIETAGNTARYANQMSLVGIIDAHEFRTKVMEYRTLLKENQKSNGSDMAINDTTLLNNIHNTLLRIEDVLKQKENLVKD